VSDEEAVLLRVRSGAAEIAVAALADVPVAILAAALAELLTGSCDGTWVLAPHDAVQAWPSRQSLRELDVLDGTAVVLRPAGSDEVSGARS
jgi:hypothetical protein